MGNKYARSPIVEAVCEFRLANDTTWDLTVPGLVYERIQGDFPLKEQHVVREIQVEGIEQGLRQQVRAVERVWFLKPDRKIFIQLGANLLAINCLKPYPTWEGFRPCIEKAFTAMNEVVAGVKGLERIGLRYINRMEIPGPSAGLNEYALLLEDYFEFRPHLGERLPQETADFILGAVLRPSAQHDLCKVQLTNAEREKPEVATFTLDLDYFLAQPRAVEPKDALLWVENAHTAVENIFEGCISDAMRTLIGEESSK